MENPPVAIQKRPRPFDDIEGEDEKMKWSMDEYGEMCKVGDDGITFTGKTANMIAYERNIESEKPEGERLFCDHLAKHFVGGDYGKRVSDMLAFGLKKIFDPTDEIGLGYEGHVTYTATRTRLINDLVAKWIESTEGNKQVLNLGAGVDTRAFWFDQLKNVQCYVEVDTQPVNDSKTKILDELKAKGELNDPHCERKIISLDFQKESTKDLPTHGFNTEVPTCAILEGLIMYLQKPEVDKLLEELSGITAAGSYTIINVMTMNPASKAEDLDATMAQHGWTKELQTMFGDEHFNYGRYPAGKAPNTMMGFIMYKK